MTYAQYNSVEASDYNSLVNSFNSVWGVGLGSSGLGQTQLSTISGNPVVSSTQWSGLANSIANLGKHQQSVINSMPTFGTGTLIEYVAALQNNLTTVITNKSWASAQSTSQSTLTSTSTQWSNSMTVTQTITFESGDKARYFFNAGGQIILQPKFTGFDSKLGATVFTNLATSAGTWVISGLGGQIVGTIYTPFTKIGGTSYLGTSIDTTLGYYNLSTSYQQAAIIYTGGSIYSSTNFGNYLNSYIKLNLKTNGTQGISNDNGTVITAETIFDEVPNGITVSGSTAVMCTIKPPSTSNLVNTWGNVTVAGTVSGS